MSDSNDDSLTSTIFGLIGGIVLFVLGFRLRKRYKIIEHTPTSKVRSVAVGLVELQGRAEAQGAQLKSPFAQVDCVYYSYTVEQRKRVGKRDQWITVASDKSSAPFRLRDATGSILIEPKGAQCSFAVDKTYRMQLFDSEQERVFKAGLDRIRFSYGALFGEKALRCSETYIVPGDAIFVLGTAQRRLGAADSKHNAENLFIGSGPHGYFILADHSEKDMLRSLRWQMYAMIFGGPVLTVWCLYWLLQRF